MGDTLQQGEMCATNAMNCRQQAVLYRQMASELESLDTSHARVYGQTLRAEVSRLVQRAVDLESESRLMMSRARSFGIDPDQW